MVSGEPLKMCSGEPLEMCSGAAPVMVHCSCGAALLVWSTGGAGDVCVMRKQKLVMQEVDIKKTNGASERLGQVFPEYLHHKHITLDNCIEILSNRDQTRYMEPCHWAIMAEEEEEEEVVVVMMEEVVMMKEEEVVVMKEEEVVVVMVVAMEEEEEEELT
uniref:Uncharacterized protein n=1 Tax=Vitis vinifera TaxID=29760 RepID=A5BIP1_VITVI|nr:hypothetical protein VITISV_017955 [Vitis vinifera]